MGIAVNSDCVSQLHSHRKVWQGVLGTGDGSVSGAGSRLSGVAAFERTPETPLGSPGSGVVLSYIRGSSVHRPGFNSLGLTNKVVPPLAPLGDFARGMS